MLAWSVEAASTSQTATLIAAAVAAVSALAAAGLGAFSASRARAWTRREQWWTRFSWAVEKATSRDRESSALGLAILLRLIDSKWAQREDNEAAVAVADVIRSRGLVNERRRRG